MNKLTKFVYNSTLARRLYHNRVGRFLYHFPADLADLVSGRRDPLVPPRWRLYTGRGDYRAVGESFLRIFIREGLKPEHTVLDIGSGMGRMAVPLTGYLNDRGRYYGLEIVKSGVRWCQRNITRRFPSFRFVHADIYNKMYNRRGRYLPDAFPFPFGDGSVDFVFLTSVFTHMLPRDVQHYLNEIGRMLKPGGVSVATANLINDGSLRRVNEGRTGLNFRYQFENYWSVSRGTPEYNIGLNEDFVRQAYANAGLKIAEPIRYGEWSGLAGCEQYQDYVVAQK